MNRNRLRHLSKRSANEAQKIAKRFSFGLPAAAGPASGPSLAQRNQESGFALLITVVVVGVVLAIGLSMLFITNRQYMLSVTANESEKAFQGAQIGLECMRYHRAQSGAAILTPGTRPSFACGNAEAVEPFNVTTSFSHSAGRQLYQYRYRYDINNQCVVTSLYIADYREATSNDPIPIAGEGLSQIRCWAGTVCTTIFSAGYNRPCLGAGPLFTVQREVVVEY